MIYGYIRVSTDKQTTENQRFEINKFAEAQEIVIERWINEEISGTKEIRHRKIGKQFKRMKAGDIIICAELSRLGRSLLMILGFLNECLKRDIRVWTIKDNYRLGDDIQSKVLAFAFGLSAEIERNLISQRTKEALARKKAEGKILGRPVGAKSSRKSKVTYKHEAELLRLYKKRVPINTIARIIGVNRNTITKYIKDYNLQDEQEEVLIEEGTKLCGCKQKVLPLSEFTKSSKSKDGYNPMCRACQRLDRKIRLGTEDNLTEEEKDLINLEKQLGTK